MKRGVMRVRGFALMFLLFCFAASCGHGGEENGARDAMEVLLRDALAETDGTFFDRARVNVNILVHHPAQTSFGAVLSYRDLAVGLDNFEDDSVTVVNHMRELVKDRAEVAVVCLAWNYRKGVLTLYGGASYGTEAGMETMRNE